MARAGPSSRPTRPPARTASPNSPTRRTAGSAYAFINCTNCGPRFTIVTGVPYDRPLTTMAGFAMCALCAREYHDPADRRFHAQPTCCPDCGPRLRLTSDTGAGSPVNPIEAAAEVLAAGGVLAVKGLGGYHLAADARSEQATAALRARKHREDKPFAVMTAGLDGARRLCAVDDVAAGLLTSRRRPIVLLQAAGRRAGRGRRRARQPASRRDAALHAAASSPARAGLRPHRPDQRQRVRRADRLPRTTTRWSG